jgi:hypothetical protein
VLHIVTYVNGVRSCREAAYAATDIVSWACGAQKFTKIQKIFHIAMGCGKLLIKKSYQHGLTFSVFFRTFIGRLRAGQFAE